MLINQDTYKIGDIIEFIYNDTPIRGIETIDYFLDQVSGETGTRLFDKYYSVSTDGVNWTDFIPLTTIDLYATTINKNDDFFLKFRYIRSGTDNTGTLILEKINVSGDYSLEYFQALNFYGTIFEKIEITDEYFNLVWYNLFQKIYGLGIVPSFIPRGMIQENSNGQDEDYISFWKSVSYFFALPLALNKREVIDFFDYKNNVLEYLKQRSLIFCNDESLDFLNNIRSNIYSEVVKRGTEVVFKQDDGEDYQEEILRSLCYNKVCDEYIYGLVKNELTGWNINVTSPMYVGNERHSYCNKFQGTYAGFTGLIKVNPSIGYEVTFMVSGSFSITGTTEDVDSNTISLKNAETGVDSGSFGGSISLVTGTHHVRAIIFPYDTENQDSSKLNIGVGNNLRFGSEDVCKLNITTTGTITDFALKPLSIPDNSYVNAHAFMNIWFKNNNEQLFDFELLELWKRYLMPYNTLIAPIPLAGEIREPNINCLLWEANLGWIEVTENLQGWLTNADESWVTVNDVPWILPESVDEEERCFRFFRDNETQLPSGDLSNDVIEISYDNILWETAASQGNDLVLCKSDYEDVIIRLRRGVGGVVTSAACGNKTSDVYIFTVSPLTGNVFFFKE